MAVVDVKELIKAGRLTEARQYLVEAVKNSPADAGSRSLLLQVLCFLGHWDKADRHLQALSVGSPDSDLAAAAFRNLILAEQERQRITEENQIASLLTDPPDYLDAFASFRQQLASGNIKEAESIFKSIEELRPPVSGKLNGNAFSGLGDTDSFLFPVLEAFVHERYVWIPFEALREVVISPPEKLMDLLWIPASITTWAGLAVNCFLPVLYPNSYQEDDERIKMGRLTQWISVGGPFARGVGQHVFEAGGQDISLLEIREVEFNLH